MQEETILRLHCDALQLFQTKRCSIWNHFDRHALTKYDLDILTYLQVIILVNPPVFIVHDPHSHLF